MDKKRATWITIPFLSIIIGFGVLNSIDIDQPESAAENRVLAQKPTYKDVLEQNYGKRYEEYYTDQFIGRDKFLKMYTKAEILSGKSTVRGLYITEDDYLLETPAQYVDLEYIQKSADIINQYGQVLSSVGKDIVYTITPFKSSMLDFKYPSYVDTSKLFDIKEEFINRLDASLINIIDVGKEFKTAFSEDELEELYFKTDHHWNGKGGYEGFLRIIRDLNNKGLISVDESQLNYTTKSIEGKYFQGSYNRQLYNLFSGEEKLEYYYQPDQPYEFYINYGGGFNPTEDTGLFATERWLDVITYGGAYVWDGPHYKIINKNALTDKKLLIFRDSYQGATSWLFADVFREVEVVDPRYIESSGNNCDNIMSESEADIVMFMFHDQALNMVHELSKNSTLNLIGTH